MSHVIEALFASANARRMERNDPTHFPIVLILLDRIPDLDSHSYRDRSLKVHTKKVGNAHPTLNSQLI
jgi:hypothetical protein